MRRCFIETRAYLDDVLDLGLAFVVEKLGDVADVDSLGATAARDENVRLVPEVSRVAERRSVRYDFAICRPTASGYELKATSFRLTWQGDVGVLDEHDVAVFRQLGRVEVDDHLAGMRQANELFAIESMRVVDDATAVDDGDCLVLR